MSTAMLTTLVPARVRARSPRAVPPPPARTDRRSAWAWWRAPPRDGPRCAYPPAAAPSPPRGTPRDDASASTCDAHDALLAPAVSPRDDDASTAAPRFGTLALSAIALALACRADAALAAEFAPTAWIKSFTAGVVGFFSTPEAKELWMYTLKTLISWGVPAGVVGVAAFFAIASSRPAAAPTVPIERNPRADPSDSSAAARRGRASVSVRHQAHERQARLVRVRVSVGDGVQRIRGCRYASAKAFAEKYAATLGTLTVAEREAVTKATGKWRRQDAALRAKMAAVSRSMRSAAVKKASKGGKKGRRRRRRVRL